MCRRISPHRPTARAAQATILGLGLLGCDHRPWRISAGTFPGDSTGHAAGAPGQRYPALLLPAAPPGEGLEVRVPNPQHARVVHPPVGGQRSCVEGTRSFRTGRCSTRLGHAAAATRRWAGCPAVRAAPRPRPGLPRRRRCWSTTPPDPEGKVRFLMSGSDQGGDMSVPVARCRFRLGLPFLSRFVSR